MPAYNAADYVSQCVESILRQSFSDFELILVDDGSSDETPLICDAFASKDARIHVVHTANFGVAHARNVGMDMARGRYLWFVDADDLVEASALERLNAEMERSGADCVLFDSTRLLEDGRREVSPLFTKAFAIDDPLDLDELHRYFLYPPCSRFYTPKTKTGFAAPWSKFFRASAVRESGVKFNEELACLYEDGLFTLEVFDHIKSVLYINEPLYVYRILSESLIHAYKTDLLRRREMAFRAIEEWLVRTNKDETFWSAYYCHVISHFGGLISRYFYHPDKGEATIAVRNEIKETLGRDPFAAAARNADIAILKRKDVLLALCMRMGSIAGIRAYYLARQAKAGAND